MRNSKITITLYLLLNTLLISTTQYVSAMHSEITNHILNKTGKLDALIEMANRLNNEYIKQVIVSVGQSAAYIVKTAEELNKNNLNDTNKYKLLAFSGKFCRAVRQQNLATYQIDDSVLPSLDSPINNYHIYLQSLDLSPQVIVDKFKTKNQKTVFIDYIESGCGLASFIYLLSKIADKEHINLKLLWEATIFHAIQPGDTLRELGIDKVDYLTIKSNIGDINIKLIGDTENDNELIEKLSFSDKHNDRLVASYSLQNMAKTTNSNEFVPSQNAKLLLSIITNHIAKRQLSTQ